jgi:SAM-dependent methyltransferase
MVRTYPGRRRATTGHGASAATPDSGMDDTGFPVGFFDRLDPSPDADFYRPPRLVTHIDDAAIAAVSDLYDELGVGGSVLDLMSSWVSHLRRPPARLVVLGMNDEELRRNPMASERVVHDLNAEPRLPFPDAEFDFALCCVSVDYLVDPVGVFREVARTLRPGGTFVCTFSNRLFSTKAVRGWLAADDDGRMAIVERYFVASGRWLAPVAQRRTPPAHRGDPLLAVWARTPV